MIRSFCFYGQVRCFVFCKAVIAEGLPTLFQSAHGDIFPDFLPCFFRNLSDFLNFFKFP
jgi:hypothetical protein